jgi:hypothetical protein
MDTEIFTSRQQRGRAGTIYYYNEPTITVSLQCHGMYRRGSLAFWLFRAARFVSCTIYERHGAAGCVCLVVQIIDCTSLVQNIRESRMYIPCTLTAHRIYRRKSLTFWSNIVVTNVEENIRDSRMHIPCRLACWTVQAHFPYVLVNYCCEKCWRKRAGFTSVYSTLVFHKTEDCTLIPIINTKIKRLVAVSLQF